MSRAVVLILGAAVFVSVAAGATATDHGRRLAGPFCIGKVNARPVGRIPRAGVVRSVAVTQACRTDEVRRVGLAVPDSDVGSRSPIVPGPPGQQGATGARGDTGAAGPAGAQGANGASGLGNGTVTLCVNPDSGSVGFVRGVGKSECNNGHSYEINVVVVK